MASTGSAPLWSRLASSFAASLRTSVRKLLGRPKVTIGALGISFAGAIALLNTFVPATLLVISVILFGTGLLMWQTGNLAYKNRILEVTLENMAHGLCMFDGQQRLIVCNERYAKMYRLKPEEMRPGTTLRSILEARVAAGSSPAAGQEYIDTRLAEVTRNEPYSAVNELRDGRVVAVTHQPIEGGGWVAIHQDITDSRRDEERVAFMLLHDLLTGLANRTNFMEKLEEAGARLRRRHETFTVFMLDLDRFTVVNDTLGHLAGDTLLKQTADRLMKALRETDLVARLGGDEFAIIQAGEADQLGAAVELAKRIITLISAPYDLHGNMVTIGTSIGIAMAREPDVDPDTLMKQADLALYAIKGTNRGTYQFYQESINKDFNERRQIEAYLREAIERKELELYYQPIINVRRNAVSGFEALVRWRQVPPAVFIPVAEDSGLIVRLGEWALLEACSNATKWPNDAKVAVNLSPAQFTAPNLFEMIEQTLAKTGLAPHRLELEITERIFMENTEYTLATLRRIKSLGVRIALDGFGTGYSSLSYLRIFPFDKIKLDRAFASDLSERDELIVIVRVVVSIARALGMTTAAEGVETDAQCESLATLGCDEVQG
jgi:diguanylate cyclase (GGDEF)-like protein